MKNLKSYLTAVVFALAGAAVHANAATETKSCGASVCFQLTPLAENGSSKTPLGMQLEKASETVAENGSSHTTQGQRLERQSEQV